MCACSCVHVQMCIQEARGPTTMAVAPHVPAPRACEAVSLISLGFADSASLLGQ